MSFEKFKKLKTQLKNNKSLSLALGQDLEVCERTIVEEIYNQMGYTLPQNQPNSHKSLVG